MPTKRRRPGRPPVHPHFVRKSRGLYMNDLEWDRVSAAIDKLVRAGEVPSLQDWMRDVLLAAADAATERLKSRAA